MDMKRFHEKNMHTALQKIREELGDNAVIISSSQNSSGVEVVAATDYEAVENSDVIPNIEFYEKSSIANMQVASKSLADRHNIDIEPVVHEIDTSAIQKEISQLRAIIESQTELISWNKLIDQNTVARRLLQKLSISGFGFNLSKLLLGTVKSVNDFDSAWSQIEVRLKDKLSMTQECVIESGGIVALVGPTGVGKTTTIAKIAAQYAMQHGNSDIAIISTDHFRIGAHDQISIYGSILNVPVVTANDESELHKALKIVKNKKLVLIDTAGLSQRDARVQEVMQALSKLSKDLITYLVISANSQLCVQKEIINNFRSDNINGVVVSKTDEASQIGGVLTALIEQSLPLAYETTGQRVPEDIVRPNQDEILNKALDYGERFGSMESLHSTELYSELVENV
ncbi:MAG: flagellar biosynthesis protein FlhF [Gammaproteobacteria bacterium]|nr:flagellar biosynthesis protein FlhF [Gammaproteobacteria bacterium]